MGSLTFTDSSIQDLDGKVFIVTGGNSGVVSASLLLEHCHLTCKHTQQMQVSSHHTVRLSHAHGLTIMFSGWHGSM